jgi:phosphogluconate dehydratase
MEVMGLHMPGAAFVNPNTPLRDALTVAATERACAITALGEHYTPIGHTVDEKAIVNAMVGLAATGRTSASSPPTTTCSPRTSRTSAIRK